VEEDPRSAVLPRLRTVLLAWASARRRRVGAPRARASSRDGAYERAPPVFQEARNTTRARDAERFVGNGGPINASDWARSLKPNFSSAFIFEKARSPLVSHEKPDLNRREEQDGVGGMAVGLQKTPAIAGHGWSAVIEARARRPGVEGSKNVPDGPASRNPIEGRRAVGLEYVQEPGGNGHEGHTAARERSFIRRRVDDSNSPQLLMLSGSAPLPMSSKQKAAVRGSCIRFGGVGRKPPGTTRSRRTSALEGR